MPKRRGRNLEDHYKARNRRGRPSPGSDSSGARYKGTNLGLTESQKEAERQIDRDKAQQEIRAHQQEEKNAATEAESRCVTSSQCASGYACVGGGCVKQEPSGGRQYEISGGGGGSCALPTDFNPRWPVFPCGGAVGCGNDNCYSTPDGSNSNLGACGPEECCRFDAASGSVKCFPGWCGGPPDPPPYAPDPTFPGAPEPPKDPIECGPDNPCPEGLECQNDVCVPTGCDSNADCPSGFICQNGTCIPDVTCPATPCPVGFKCVNGVCVPDPFVPQPIDPPVPSPPTDPGGDDGNGTNRCSQWCDSYKELFGEDRPGCGGLSCDECTTCQSGTCKRAFINSPSEPCWCNPSRCEGKDCQVCQANAGDANYGSCDYREDCQYCSTVYGPCCGETRYATGCASRKEFGEAAPNVATARAYQKLEDCNDSCPDKPPIEASDCNCNLDCPECQLCGADGKCYLNPVCAS